MFRRTARLILRLCLALLAAVALYATAAVVLGLIPVNRDWRGAQAKGVTIWLTTNGVHAALVLPVQAEGTDWSTLFPLQDTLGGDAVQDRTMISIGWGERTFFLETPTWGDLRLSSALYALSGQGGSVLHVEYTYPPMPGQRNAVPLHLPAAAYARLVQYIRASTQMRDGGAVTIPNVNYSFGDAFYAAQGRYSPLNTCNQWVRNALAVAGVRTAVWAPFDVALFWQVRD